jgi:hypothetical protein
VSSHFNCHVNIITVHVQKGRMYVFATVVCYIWNYRRIKAKFGLINNKYIQDTRFHARFIVFSNTHNSFVFNLIFFLSSFHKMTQLFTSYIIMSYQYVTECSLVSSFKTNKSVDNQPSFRDTNGKSVLVIFYFVSDFLTIIIPKGCFARKIDC